MWPSALSYILFLAMYFEPLLALSPIYLLNLSPNGVLSVPNSVTTSTFSSSQTVAARDNAVVPTAIPTECQQSESTNFTPSRFRTPVNSYFARVKKIGFGIWIKLPNRESIVTECSVYADAIKQSTHSHKGTPSSNYILTPLVTPMSKLGVNHQNMLQPLIPEVTPVSGIKPQEILQPLIPKITPSITVHEITDANVEDVEVPVEPLTAASIEGFFPTRWAEPSPAITTLIVSEAAKEKFPMAEHSSSSPFCQELRLVLEKQPEEDPAFWAKHFPNCFTADSGVTLEKTHAEAEDPTPEHTSPTPAATQSSELALDIFRCKLVKDYLESNPTLSSAEASRMKLDYLYCFDKEFVSLAPPDKVGIIPRDVINTDLPQNSILPSQVQSKTVSSNTPSLELAMDTPTCRKLKASLENRPMPDAQKRLYRMRNIYCFDEKYRSLAPPEPSPSGPPINVGRYHTIANFIDHWFKRRDLMDLSSSSTSTEMQAGPTHTFTNPIHQKLSEEISQRLKSRPRPTRGAKAAFKKPAMSLWQQKRSDASVGLHEMNNEALPDKISEDLEMPTSTKRSKSSISPPNKTSPLSFQVLVFRPDVSKIIRRAVNSLGDLMGESIQNESTTNSLRKASGSTPTSRISRRAGSWGHKKRHLISPTEKRQSDAEQNEASGSEVSNSTLALIKPKISGSLSTFHSVAASIWRRQPEHPDVSEPSEGTASSKSKPITPGPDLKDKNHWSPYPRYKMLASSIWRTRRDEKDYEGSTVQVKPKGDLSKYHRLAFSLWGRQESHDSSKPEMFQPSETEISTTTT